jgi:hypothetical protein
VEGEGNGLRLYDVEGNDEKLQFLLIVTVWGDDFDF